MQIKWCMISTQTIESQTNAHTQTYKFYAPRFDQLYILMVFIHLHINTQMVWLLFTLYGYAAVDIVTLAWMMRWLNGFGVYPNVSRYPIKLEYNQHFNKNQKIHLDKLNCN